MGRNKRRGNRWKAKNADKARLGSGSGSGTTADSEDDPESYTNPGSTNRRKRGSGKLRGGTRDDAANRNGAEASPAPNNINGDNEPSGAGLRAEGGLSGGPQEEGVESAAHISAAADLLEQQRQQKDEHVQHTREIDETGGVDDEKKEDLSEVDAKAVNGPSGGGNDDDTNSGVAASPRDPPSQAVAPSTCRGVIVPALPLSSSLELASGGRGGKTGRVRSAFGGRQNKQYSLAWAGGKKGRPLMKNVGDVLSGWLCAQEAKVTSRIEYIRINYLTKLERVNFCSEEILLPAEQFREEATCDMDSIDERSKSFSSPRIPAEVEPCLPPEKQNTTRFKWF